MTVTSAFAFLVALGLPLWLVVEQLFTLARRGSEPAGRSELVGRKAAATPPTRAAGRPRAIRGRAKRVGPNPGLRVP
jgi:hypothetical protein